MEKEEMENSSMINGETKAGLTRSREGRESGIIRLMRLPLGLLINFGAATFKDGIKRITNNHHDFAASRLRVNSAILPG